ncbi:MAG: PrgI family protein [Oscillospiraceae bacterium]
MEIKINKEIRAYRETLFFGLSTRQFICSVLAVGVAVGLYFSLSRCAGPGNGELGVHCRRGSRGRCGLFSVQRPDT